MENNLSFLKINYKVFSRLDFLFSKYFTTSNNYLMVYTHIPPQFEELCEIEFKQIEIE